jgi:hypothetical protein
MKKLFALLFAIALVGGTYATTYTANSVNALEQNDQDDKKKKKAEAKETPKDKKAGAKSCAPGSKKPSCCAKKAS